MTSPVCVAVLFLYTNTQVLTSGSC